MIQAPRFDATLDVTRKLLAKNQVLSVDLAPDEYKNERISLRTSEATPMIVRASSNMC